MRTTDRLAGTIGFTAFAAAIAFGFSTNAAFAQQQAEVCDCTPLSGQPAADVIASHDRWGNPTFIGGITNGGPDAGSVW